ncbi:MAG: hypothetical protein J1F31_01900 [Erysipelotrichales bacterium]|nr:hypothetical protein [Erysipelotrichales bacterium]
MDDKLDLWGNVNCNKNIASTALSLIRGQANLLKEKTDGKVTASLSLVHYQYKNLNSEVLKKALIAASEISSTLCAPNVEKIEKDETQNLENADSLFEKNKYKFEIYSRKYKFRLFTLNYQSVFPLRIEIEDGILGEKFTIEYVESISALKQILGLIFESDKVRFIIKRMIDLDKDE